MGLEQLKLVSNFPPMQGMDGAGAAATAGTPQDPLMFLQQLLAQLQGAAGAGQALPPELRAMLQNGQLLAPTADGRSAVDALKAAVAALQSGQAAQGQLSPDAGKTLPAAEAEAGNTLPPEWAALLAESMAGGADGIALGVEPDKSMAGKEDIVEDQGLLSLDGVAPQQVPMFLPSPDVAIPPQPIAIDSAPASTGPAEAKAGESDSAMAAANKPALTDQGPAHVEPRTAAERDGLSDTVVASASAADGSAPPASNRADNSLQGQDQGFATTLATATAAASGPLAAPLEGRGAAASAPAPLATPVGQPGWGQELGERIVWMTGKSLDSAEIHLNPPHLGPVEVRVTMQHDQASIQFVSGHAAVREAIEAAVPRLREMMSDQQLALVDVNVSSHSQQQQFAGRDGSRPRHPLEFAFSERGQGGDNDEARLVEAPMTLRTSSGVLSVYA